MSGAYARTFDWTPEATTLAVKLYHDGLSCSQIAKKLGGLSRNAVIGKLTRLGLTGNRAASPPPPKATPPGPAAAPRRLGIAGNGAIYEQAPDAEASAFKPREHKPTGQPCTLIHVTGCRWPIDDPGFGRMQDAMFCNGERDGDHVYCRAHGKVAVQRQAPNGKRHMTANELARSLRKYVA